MQQATPVRRVLVVNLTKALLEIEGCRKGLRDMTRTWHLLEERQVFARSLLWGLQRRYYVERGADAWRQGEVPQYITSNPVVANAYAEIIFAFWRDQNRLHSQNRQIDHLPASPSAARRAHSSENRRKPPSGAQAWETEPLTICELGAGSGRLAFHFLRRLTTLCHQNDVSPAAFRYVLTDFTQNNLDAWRDHSHFQEFFDSGLLDMALLDVGQTDALALQISGKTIRAGDLRRPLVVIANYVFDSIPQELFYIEEQVEERAATPADEEISRETQSAEQAEKPEPEKEAGVSASLINHVSQCLLSLSVDKAPETLDAAETLARLVWEYDYGPLTSAPFAEPAFQSLLDAYARRLSATHLFFPAVSLRCLQRLKALSSKGVMLLSADKGDHRFASLEARPAPGLMCNGGISFNVNFHAFGAFCEQAGGAALFPACRHSSMSVSCLLMLRQANDYRETRRAYEQQVQDFGPDDFYTIMRHAQEHSEAMPVADILAYLRLSRYDSHQFGRFYPRLLELAPDLDGEDRRAVSEAVDHVWSLYFPLGDGLDMAYNIAVLLYMLGDYTRALLYFERSLTSQGAHRGALYHMVLCHQLLGQEAEAEARQCEIKKLDAGEIFETLYK